MKKKIFLICGLSVGILGSGFAQMQPDLGKAKKEKLGSQPSVTVQTTVGPLKLPSPYTTKSVEKRSEIIAWPENGHPKAPEGFSVTKFAENLDHPRRTYIAPNGEDIFVVESDDAKKSANQITLFRDSNKDGNPEERFFLLST